MASPYRRVILKLSGEALGLDGKLFCHEKFETTARMLIDIQRTGENDRRITVTGL